MKLQNCGFNSYIYILFNYFFIDQVFERKFYLFSNILDLV